MSTFAEQDAKLERATEAILQATKDEKQLVRMAGRDFEDLREEIVFAGERVRKVSLRKTPKTLDDKDRKRLQDSVTAALAANRKYDEALHAHLMDMIALQRPPHRLVMAILKQRRKNIGDHLYADQINAARSKLAAMVADRKRYDVKHRKSIKAAAKASRKAFEATLELLETLKLRKSSELKPLVKELVFLRAKAELFG